MTQLAEDETPARIRRSTIGVISLIVLLHVLGWGVLILLVIPAGIPLGGGGGTVVTLGVGLTAYALGVRHAFDADHIAAIDNTARRLAERGKPASTVGFWFSLGHSTIVVVLCILLTLGITAIGSSLADDSSALRTWTGVIGPTVSGVFLLVIAAINIASLRRRHGHAGGPVLRMLGPFEKAVDRPSRMYIVGLLFGLGFDTATEIGLLALAGAATLAAVPWWAALTLPILFAAGMSAFDTTQGAVMRLAYTWQPGRRHLGRVYAMAMTGLSVAAAVLIASVQLADVLVANLGLGGPLPWLASVGIDDLGLVLTGVLLVTWAAVLFVTRWPRLRTS
ncbi:MAG TPA: HoxN/HupN/NixA family nickel/cobalt transporter [Microbacterium sp.]|uniref:HoxN/HupN/NixA family nickel/cobalt transporter n=1 Tax=Microbacterium sp. TaxID=51671 RepID=UPI002B51C8BC|nr:HoxN/HupN/NixA family nickel/cobalt transporter [Microbacterium sp.]HWI30835.1 HoxN/HupN/NixA family nickel/cobalt transporter [Microbacterium sp.]